VLGTLGGALVIPATAVVSEMGVEFIVLAFAVVVIGGLFSSTLLTLLVIPVIYSMVHVRNTKPRRARWEGQRGSYSVEAAMEIINFRPP
jgi:branched-subunit amino acid ABC-type transport system permease component